MKIYVKKNSISYRANKVNFDKAIKQIPLKWNKTVDYKLLTFDLPRVQVVDILAAFQPHYYLSHFSALYLHGLTKHRPVEYFLSKEIIGRIPYHPKKKMLDEQIRQAFLKSSRKTSKYLMYKKTKITFLEKQDLGKIGIKTNLLQIDESRRVRVFFTSLERTLIDSIISPQYSGGIKTVVSAFYKARIDTTKLYKIYESYSPLYPYWQSIGFLLHKLKTDYTSKKWSQYFSCPNTIFYLDRNFSENWLYDSKWKIYYPKGLFDDNC